MTKLILIRHGETEWNAARRFQGQTDVPLSETGKEQARMLAKRFPAERVNAIYSSDLVRARETADAIAKKFGCEVHPEPNLREMNFGQWEGLDYDEIVRRWPDEGAKLWPRPDLLRVPSGETVQELQDRAMGVIRRIISTEKAEDAIVITAHGAVIRSIICAMLSIPLRCFWSIRQSNTAVNIANYLDGQWFIELMNSTAHLE